MNTYISHYVDFDEVEDIVKNTMQHTIIKNNKNKEHNMNKNLKRITKCGYTVEATTGKNGEGYMYLVRSGARIVRVTFMTNNRSAKKIVEELPLSRNGSHADLAMKLLVGAIKSLNVI